MSYDIFALLFSGLRFHGHRLARKFNRFLSISIPIFAILFILIISPILYFTSKSIEQITYIKISVQSICTHILKITVELFMYDAITECICTQTQTS